MVALTWLSTVAAVVLFAWPPAATATPGFRKSASPSFRSSASICPERCSNSGPNTGNWSVYADFKQIRKCKETMFYDFSLFDHVDDRNGTHRIQACSSYGPDFAGFPASTARIASIESVEVEFELGWWHEGFGLAGAGLRSLVKQMRQYAEGGHGPTDRPFIIYGQSGQATIGLYVGQGLLKQGLSQSALKLFQDNLDKLEVSTPSLAMQLCEEGYDSTHVFGVMATSNGTFAPIQSAIKAWANATCLSFSGSTKFAGSAKFTTPLLHGNHTTTNSTILVRNLARNLVTRARGKCATIQVEAGNSCAELAVKCGISGADFTKYNPGADFCSKLKPKQHVCCSSGDLPDFRPQPNEDGSCKAYQVQAGDNCDSLAAEYSLKLDDLEAFNKNTWGWNGCGLLFKDTVLCLSEGTPPFPAEISNAQCGPQKPGTTPPTNGSNIADLNPCPLNACCNIWGQCGITTDFCIDTNTGAPGTAEPGTYGCISNCGLDVVKGSGSGTIKIAYYEGYCLSRKCLFQDASQIDSSQYTHLHFGFGTLTGSWEVETGDELSTYQFGEFKKISGIKRILSLGGWDFSTTPETYQIFRNGVKPANRLTMATKIATFIKENDLDGVDIDWEYPGAPDLPDFDPGSQEDGPNYLAFLVLLKSLLPGKSISIAAPASYWYLKQYPIEDIAKVTDYIVYMTYDLHGQWDVHNSNSQEGCDTGSCLRSQVNLTETRQSLAMITKAGVPGAKVIVGVTSYGRSFKMADPGCWGPDCLYTGDRLKSHAKKGTCTGTAGYLADAEIAEIMKDSSRVVKSYVDPTSNSDVLIYDRDEWVGYMSAATKKTRSSLYAAWGLGGTSDWASDLQTYHDAPRPATSWATFIQLARAGEDPKTDRTRNGNWTDFDCTNWVVADFLDYTPSERWRLMGTDAAWDDIVRIWKGTDRQRGKKFIGSVESTIQMGGQQECGRLVTESCSTIECEKGADGASSGPAGQFIWNSLAQIHGMYKNYYDTLFKALGIVSTALGDMENKFAPIPPEKDDTWLMILVDTITLGALGTAGPFFNAILKNHNWFAGKTGSALDNAKDTAMTLIGQGTTIAKDALPGGDATKWTPEKQDEFSAYLGQVVYGWANITSLALEDLFSGSNEAIDTLYGAMSDGKLLPGMREGELPATGNAQNELLANINKCIVGFALPALWRQSGSYTFIIDAGHACNGDKRLSAYLDDDTMDTTGVCVDNWQYYLAYPDGAAKKCSCKQVMDKGPCTRICRDNKFSAPKGIEYISGGKNYNGITTTELVQGSVRTWIGNGRENGASVADPTNDGTLADLMAVDVTTPGFMRIPVCSPARAFQSWDTASKGSSPNWPCDIPPGKDECGASTFVDQTSDASPKVEDCRQIIKNIEGDGGTGWTTQVIGHHQRQIASHASCHFGVEATKTHGNVNFKVGGQDVIDIIHDAIARFARDGLIGAKGNMNCNGNVKSQPVGWGIY
ncbi:chitinase [Aspergillus sclerotiicarbonarius CBS 121057]|uniref:chitinase n=1 Tax=Aspergillus sclerotiicarbonarius (strain CBS 121057 / IBT 28362) TaxID=1448318 RepID=A0A319DVL7_ASPSB|nr:chitinase [Aspergillus sclerotiicarbonarius CBS 121057]